MRHDLVVLFAPAFVMYRPTAHATAWSCQFEQLGRRMGLADRTSLRLYLALVTPHSPHCIYLFGGDFGTWENEKERVTRLLLSHIPKD